MQSNDEQYLGQSVEQILQTLPAKVSSAVSYWAEHAPDAPAISDHLGRDFSYRELAGEISESKAFLAQQGIEAGHRVMLVNENCVPLLVAILALSELGAWPVIVNARMAEDEIARIAGHCQPVAELFFLDSEAASRHWKRLDTSGVTDTISLGGGQAGMVMHDASDSGIEPEPGMEDVFCLIYTTGTTGAPKGVMLTHRNIMFIAAISGALRGLSQQDRIYLVLPVSHVFGLSAVFLSALHYGAHFVVADRFDPEIMTRTIREQSVTGIFGVPAMYAKLTDYIASAGLSKPVAPDLRFMYSGGAPLDPAIKQNAESTFGLPLLNGYGMTESGPTICQVRRFDRLASSSVGQPLPGLVTRVLGADGKEVRRGEIGELHVRGPSIMPGYFRNPEATRATLDEAGFLNTGDMVWEDEAGNLTIAGRSKELIIHSGFNVYPPEVEAAILDHPDVLLCAVVGETVPGNEDVVAWVQPRPGCQLSEAGLLAFLKPRLTAYKRPSRVHLVSQLPTAPSGKVLKHKLGKAD
ncbi:AMP-binding protein [Pseudohongiella nitratireducens]|mgnify:CR=1 FL=1|uniref:AMP-binding protein n=1 Tax=Pseudohongiella nitratireducens TaxID=1768907 RepID=A0A917LS90_9GAMM|nr:class I adenylate-forming enzyme family protein [Pseudohongiella nitratireducens]MDF1622419.1 class I adenylate-forming enzyme family protein [Pseudohongiella nitratireducens]GGG54681.1 AMP-binding protein [Pseudohongiella nitratireducens]|tara:strand:- start:461 stop:2029 length:1569 start_codon:yes stop_codon:yes gene_type:complete